MPDGALPLGDFPRPRSDLAACSTSHARAHTHFLHAGFTSRSPRGDGVAQGAQSLVRVQRARRGCCCSSGFRLGGRQSVPRPCGPVVSRGLPRAGTTQCSPGPGLPRHTQWDGVPGARGAPAPSTPRGLQCPGSIGASLGLSVGGDAGRAVRPAPGLAGPVPARGSPQAGSLTPLLLVDASISLTGLSFAFQMGTLP